MSQGTNPRVASMVIYPTMTETGKMGSMPFELTAPGGSRGSYPSNAILTGSETMEKKEKTGLVPNEVVASESKEADHNSTLITATDPMVKDEKAGSVPSEVVAFESKETGPTLEPNSVDSILPEAESIGLKAVTVPNTTNAIATFFFYPETGRHPPVKIISDFTVKLMRGRDLTTNERQILFNILKALSQIQKFTRAAEETLQVKFMMLSIQGICPKATRPYEFPKVFRDAATAIITKLEDDLDTEEVAEPPPSTSSSPPPTLAKGKKRTTRTASSSEAEPRSLPALDDLHVQAFMHNLELAPGPRRVWRLRDKAAARPCTRFGHNGLTVGQWWPYRICALRDGAHGAMQGGIAGSEKSGAYSVVVSGDYDELDKDEKEVLYYSGSDSHLNVDPVNPILTSYTKALQQSRRDSNVIRVLRTSGGKAAHCPSKGIRYDGLYRIISEGIAINSRGGAYVRFKLVREANQAAMDLSRPNQVERDVFDRLKSSV